MAKPPSNVRKTPTPKQAAAAQIIVDRMKGGEPLSSGLVAEAHDQAYGLGGDRKKAQTYAGKNLSSPSFLSSLNLMDESCQHELRHWLWLCLQGQHPIFPKDKELMIVAAKLLARATFVEKHEVKFDEGEFVGKSSEELDHYARTGEWRTYDEIAYRAQHGVWPTIIEGNGKPN